MKNQLLVFFLLLPYILSAEYANLTKEELLSKIDEMITREGPEPVLVYKFFKQLEAEKVMPDDLEIQFLIHRKLATFEIHFRNIEALFHHTNIAIGKAELLEDELKIIDAKSVQFFAFYFEGRYEEALSLINEIEEASKPLNNLRILAEINMLKVNMLLVKDDISPALNLLVETQEIIEELNDPLLLAQIYKYLGILYTKPGYLYSDKQVREKILLYFEKALEIVESQNDILRQIQIIKEIADNYIHQKDWDKAEKFLNQQKTLIETHEIPLSVSPFYLQMGVSLIFQEEFSMAKHYLDFGYREIQKNKEHLNLPVCLYWLGIAHRGLNDYDQAAKLFNEAFDLELKDKNWGGVYTNSFALYETYVWRDQYKEALEWFRKFNTYKDTVENVTTKEQISVLTAQLETVEKEKEIELLEEQAKVAALKKNRLTIGLVLSLFLGLTLVYAQRISRKKEKQIEAEKLRNSQLEKQHLEQQLNFKEKELTSQILNLAKKNELLQEINERVELMKKSASPENTFYINKLLRTINADLNDTGIWEQFLESFKQVHQTFFERLTTEFQNLTANDLRLASLLKMNLSSKEIASLFNISDLGIKKARYRLRKKMDLDSEVNLQDYLITFN